MSLVHMPLKQRVLISCAWAPLPLVAGFASRSRHVVLAFTSILMVLVIATAVTTYILLDMGRIDRANADRSRRHPPAA